MVSRAKHGEDANRMKQSETTHSRVLNRAIKCKKKQNFKSA